MAAQPTIPQTLNIAGQYPNTVAAQKRSQYLADALKNIQASGQNIQGGYGELGAKLLADALLQYGSKKADKKLLEAQQADLNTQGARLDSQWSGLGFGGGAPTPQATSLAQGLSPTPASSAAPSQQPNPLGPTQIEQTRYQQLRQSGDIQGAQSLMDSIVSRAGAPPEYQANVVNNELVQSNKYDPGKIVSSGPVGQDLVNVNGTLRDRNDPKNANAFTPQVGPGQVPLYDSQGRPAAVQEMSGFAQAQGNLAQAQAAGTQRGQIPYDLTTIQGPNGPVTDSRANLLSQGPIQGRSPDQQAYMTGLATNAAASQNTLQGTLDSATQALGVIQQLRNSPDLNARTGLTGLLPAIPGTGGANFDAMNNQIKGSAFLEAFNRLKGGGAISEVEGQKATQAIARLDRKLSPEDYKAALDEVASVFNAGIQRAQQNAQRGAPPAINANTFTANVQAGAQGGGQGGWSIVGVQ